MDGRTSLARIASGAARLWNAGAGARVRLYRHGLLRQRRLNAKVISIGNIAWGGSGKTPFTLWLARHLEASGIRPSILTRGYRRNSREPVQILPPDTPPEEARDAGEEAQIYLRRLRVPLGISASRYDAGRQLEARFPVDVHLLDDGFQHLALWRDLDLVLLDAQNPWGRRGLFPSLLREPLSALGRADAVLLTRYELASSAPPEDSGLEALRATLKQINPAAPCFTVRTQLLYFQKRHSEARIPIEQILPRRALAFCGLGNPEGFFGMLAQAAIPVIARKVFPDHHRYSPRDLSRLEQAAAETQADCLLTTEKDLLNLPEGASGNLPIYWAAIELVVEEEPRLLAWIADRLQIFETSAATIPQGAGNIPATSARRSPSIPP